MTDPIRPPGSDVKISTLRKRFTRLREAIRSGDLDAADEAMQGVESTCDIVLALSCEVARLRAEVETLREEVDRLRAALAHVSNCVHCGRIVDAREVAEGGDAHGAEIRPGEWVCSSECWDAALAAGRTTEDQA